MIDIETGSFVVFGGDVPWLVGEKTWFVSHTTESWLMLETPEGSIFRCDRDAIERSARFAESGEIVSWEAVRRIYLPPAY